MIVESFSQSVINSGVFRLYVGTGFFATLIFFVINATLFTPLEMVFWIIVVTVVLKGIANMMLSFIIMLFSFDNKQSEFDFKYNEEKINTMLNELVMKENIELVNENK